MQKIVLAVLGSVALLMAATSANATSVRIRTGEAGAVRVHDGDGMRHGHGMRRGHHDRWEGRHHNDRWEGRHHRRHWRHGGWRHRDRDAGVSIIIGRDRGHRRHRDRDVEYSK